MFEPLGKSNIEGIEILARQFDTVSMNLKKKQYDMLAPRTVEFETDFVKFMSEISHIEVCIVSFSLQLLHRLSPSLLIKCVKYRCSYKMYGYPYLQNQLRAFMSSCFSKIYSSQQALALIQRSV